MQQRDDQLQRLQETSATVGDYYQCVAKSWSGTADEKLYRHIRAGKARTFQVCDSSKSVQYLMMERLTKVNVKSSRFIGTHILTKAKVSIINFGNGVCDTFDPKKNPSIANEMEAMQLTSVLATLILTDTDSGYFNFLGIFNCGNPSNEECHFQSWVREAVIVYNAERVDTSNLEQSPFKNTANKKRLNMFQFLTPTPNMSVVAVNPKEYICMYRKDGDNDKEVTTMSKHKGVPKKIRLCYEDYSQCARSFDYLKQHHDALKSGSVSYCHLGAVKNSVLSGYGLISRRSNRKYHLQV